MKFNFSGKRAGRPEAGVVEAKNERHARDQLEQRGIQIQSLSKIGKSIKNKRPPKPRINSEDLGIFTRQMSTMISAGIPLLEALEIMAEQESDAGFRHVLSSVVASVREGTDLSSAMAAHPKVFEKIYVNMIKAGEASGAIDTILDRLAGYLESAAKLKGEIKSAMTYPVISLVMVLGITLFLMVVVVPQFDVIFKSLGAPLPAPTKLVLDISNSLTEGSLYWIIGAVVLWVSFILIKKTPSGAFAWDTFKLKAPVFGPIVTKVCLARFSRTFSTLLNAGVPILSALDIVAKTCGNLVLEKAVIEAQDNVREGNDLSTPLMKSNIFPLMVVRMIGIGEKSGALETLLEKVADFYDAQVEAAVKSLTSLIEPIMIGIMGVLVGGVVLAIFLPIFEAPGHL